jgi:hypothetical protein
MVVGHVARPFLWLYGAFGIVRLLFSNDAEPAEDVCDFGGVRALLCGS